MLWMSGEAWITHEERAALPGLLCVSSHTESNSIHPQSFYSAGVTGWLMWVKTCHRWGIPDWIPAPYSRPAQLLHLFSPNRDTCTGHKSHRSPILWAQEHREEKGTEQGRKKGLSLSWPCRNKVTQTQATAGEQLEHTGGRQSGWSETKRKREREGCELQEKRARKKDMDGDVENRGCLGEAVWRKKMRKQEERRKSCYLRVFPLSLQLWSVNTHQYLIIQRRPNRSWGAIQYAGRASIVQK